MLSKAEDVVGKLNAREVHYVDNSVLDIKPTLFLMFGLLGYSNPILMPAIIKVLVLLFVNAVKTS